MSAAPLQTQAALPQPSGGVSFAQGRRGTHDALEREADRIADTVLAGKANPRAPAAPPDHPRASHPHGVLPASVARALRHHGTPLEPALRTDMEARFGHDFARVRVHCDPLAAQSARAIGAAAYTVGDAVAFGHGRYAPATREGRHLIAHELTHVVQQSGTRSSSMPISAAPITLMRSEDDDSWFPSAADITDPFAAIRLINRLAAVPFVGSTIREALVASASKKVVALFDLDPALLAQVKDVYDDPEKYLEQLRGSVQPYIETIPAYAVAEASRRLAELEVYGEPLARVMRTVGVQLSGLGANWWPILKQTVMQQIMLWDWSVEAASLAELDGKYKSGALDTIDYGLQVVQVVLGGLDRVLGAIGIGLWIVSFVGGTGVGTAGGGAVGSLAAGAGAAPGAAAGGGTGATAGGTVGAGAFEFLGTISNVTSIGAQAAALAKSVADLAVGEDDEAATEEDYQLIASTIVAIGILVALFVLGSIGAAVAKKLANRLREIAPRVVKALPSLAAPKIAPEAETRLHVPSRERTAVPRPDLGEGVALMVPSEQMGTVVRTTPTPPRSREVIDVAPALPEKSPALLTDRGAAPELPAKTPLALTDRSAPAAPEPTAARASHVPETEIPETLPAHEPPGGKPPLVTTKEIRDVDRDVEELLGGASHDALEHPEGTALVPYKGEPAPAAAIEAPLEAPAAAAVPVDVPVEAAATPAAAPAPVVASAPAPAKTRTPSASRSAKQRDAERLAEAAKPMSVRTAENEAALESARKGVIEYKRERVAAGKTPKGGPAKALWNRYERKWVLERKIAYPDRQLLEQATMVGVRMPDGTLRPTRSIAPKGRIFDFLEIDGGRAVGGDLKSEAELIGSVAGGIKKPDDIALEWCGSSKIGEQHDVESSVRAAAEAQGGKIVLSGFDVATGRTVSVEVDPGDLISVVWHYEEVFEN